MSSATRLPCPECGPPARWPGELEEHRERVHAPGPTAEELAYSAARARELVERLRSASAPEPRENEVDVAALLAETGAARAA